jgi:citrate lyase subunit beta/citryl-CoA lyase
MRRRRTLLFVCGADPAALQAARASGADSLILDLEDTVVPDQKPRARRLVADALRASVRPGPERAVRVNAPGTAWLAEDIATVVAAGAEALVLPKAEHPAQVEAAAVAVASAERAAGRSEGQVALLPLVETPLGVLHAHALAGASPRVQALVVGHVDLCRALGVREAGAAEGIVLHARCQVVLGARAAGRQAIDAVFMDLRDPEGLAREARQGLALGFAGKLVIDESQVAVVHAAFRPGEEEVAYARRLVAAWEAAQARGEGLLVFEGRVVDLPVVEAERSVLARALGNPQNRV